jgi:non-canonical (house-cleaning) NTP pyrophosphatase
MTTYKFYDASLSGNNHKQNTAYATPGDNNQICVRRATVDTSKQTLTASTPDIAQAIPLSINEVVLGVWVRVATAESTANCEFSVGLDADNVRFIDPVVATTANTVASEFTEAVHVASNTQHITVVPSNSVDMDTAVIEVAALISKSFDADGDVPSPGYHIPIGG